MDIIRRIIALTQPDLIRTSIRIVALYKFPGNLFLLFLSVRSNHFHVDLIFAVFLDPHDIYNRFLKIDVCHRNDLQLRKSLTICGPDNIHTIFCKRKLIWILLLCQNLLLGDRFFRRKLQLRYLRSIGCIRACVYKIRVALIQLFSVCRFLSVLIRELHGALRPGIIRECSILIKPVDLQRLHRLKSRRIADKDLIRSVLIDRKLGFCKPVSGIGYEISCLSVNRRRLDSRIVRKPYREQDRLTGLYRAGFRNTLSIQDQRLRRILILFDLLLKILIGIKSPRSIKFHIFIEFCHLTGDCDFHLALFQFMVSKVHRNRIEEAVALIFRLDKAEIISADRNLYLSFKVEIHVVRKGFECKFSILISLTGVSHVREYICEGAVGGLIPERFLSIRECQCRVCCHDVDTLCVDSECHIGKRTCFQICDTDDSGSRLLRCDGKLLCIRIVEETSKILLLTSVSTADLTDRHGRFLRHSCIADSHRDLHGISKDQV